MATKLQIYNMALSAARGQGSLKSLTQATRGREECDKWFDLVLDVTQEAAYWPCCKRVTALAGQTEEDPASEWLYSYTLPVDFLRPWYLDGFERFSLESKETDPGDPAAEPPIPPTYSTRLFANTREPRLYYAQRVVDTTRWPANMVQAFVYGLAYKVSEGLTGKGDLVERLLGLANGYLLQAQSVSVGYGSDARVLESDPSWIIARGAGISPIDRFFYPYGEVWTAIGGSPQTRRISGFATAPPRIA